MLFRSHLRGLLEQVDPATIAVALHAGGHDVRKKVLAAMSHAVARRVRQEMDRMGPVRISEIEDAQQQVVEAVQSHLGRYVSSQTPNEIIA